MYVSSVMVFLAVTLFSMAGFSQDSDYMDSYTGADADMVGSDSCTMCHRDSAVEGSHVDTFDGDEDCADYGFGCEACHGPGGDHMGDADGILRFTEMSTGDVTDNCTGCHDDQGSFNLGDWEDGTHLGAGMSCLACHGGHSSNDMFLHEDGANAMCSSCHAEVGDQLEAGDHGVPGSDMTCADCHNPHE